MSDKDKKKLKEDQLAASKVLPLIDDHHRLLVTLLLMNSVANEALPLFLDAIVPSWAAVLISVSLVLVFGEIIPSAIFTGSQQLRIAARFSGVVSCASFLLAPIAWPMAKGLDCLLGHNHMGRYNFAELRAIVGIQNTQGEAVFASCDSEGYGIITTEQVHNFEEDSIVEFTSKQNVPAVSTKLLSDKTLYFVAPCPPMHGRNLQTTFKLYSSEERNKDDLICLQKGDIESGVFKTIERDEVKIMDGVMKMTHMEAVKAMTSMRKVNMLESSEALTLDKLQHIYKQGHSRLPVYDGHRHNLRGFVLTKSMITVSPSPADEKLGKVTRVNDLKLQKFVVITPTTPMLELLNKFQEKKCHMALIVNEPEAVQDAWSQNIEIPADVHMMGIVTMEDVIEEMLQEEIEDENEGDDGMVERNTTGSKPDIPAKADNFGVSMRMRSMSNRDISVVPSNSPVSAPPKSRIGDDLARPLLEKAPPVASNPQGGGDKIAAINNRAGEATFSYRQ
jgi:metal transporter CNNM